MPHSHSCGLSENYAIKLICPNKILKKARSHTDRKQVSRCQEMGLNFTSQLWWSLSSCLDLPKVTRLTIDTWLCQYVNYESIQLCHVGVGYGRAEKVMVMLSPDQQGRWSRSQYWWEDRTGSNCFWSWNPSVAKVTGNRLQKLPVAWPPA